MTYDLAIRNGTIVTETDTFEAGLLVENEHIAGFVTPETEVDARKEVDASGKFVLPGVVDPHVHVAEPNNIDDFEHGSRAAALGGITTFITFAWQAWVGEQSPWDAPGPLREGVERQLKAGSDSLVDYALHGTLSREDDSVLDEIEALVSDGITSFKLFTAYEFGLSNGFIEQVFERIAEYDAVAVVHTEDDSICTAREAKMRASGRGAPSEYPESRPDHAEAMAADDALRMARETGIKYYGFHTTSRAAAEVIDQYRTDGSHVRGETCTHYTTLDATAYENQGTLPVIAPPLRTPDDRDAMFEHLRTGTLDVVSTDHVGFKRSEKQANRWWDAPYGANSVQRSLPVFHDEAVVNRGYSYPFLVRVMCSNPARTFGLPAKGTLSPGTDADLVVFDPDAKQTIRAEDNASLADYSIYEGREVTGVVDQTYVRGQLVAERGDVVAENGYGEFIERPVPDWQQ
jgi:dihydropyrimidinase